MTRIFPRLQKKLPLPLVLIGMVLLAALATSAVAAPKIPDPHSRTNRIHYDGQCMTIDGHDLVIYSGSFHFARCPKPLWRARFEKIKQAGFNTVETYVPWNYCEPQMPASLDDSSKVNLQDLNDWLNMAESFGLYIIIRPGPYICAEYDRGGFPGWLITKRPADYPARAEWFRSDDPTFIAWSKHWYDAVCPLLAKHQVTSKKPGSPGIILFQLENEYDYSGIPESQKMPYIKALAEEAAARGINVPFFTCWTHAIRGNTDPVLSKIFDSCNFYPGWSVDAETDRMSELRRQQPDAPMMTAELQGGWFTGIGQRPPLRPDTDHYRPDLVPSQINNLTLYVWQNGETITNYYMLFGGTNLGYEAAQGIATSYDYSAPIRENGGVGAKYLVVKALGEMIHEYGNRLARTKLVDCDVTTGHKDVTVVERISDDGSRFLFLRTNQHTEPRSGTAHVKEKSGPLDITFDYKLAPFGSKVLYLPPGITDPDKGQWLPKEPAEITRPSDLPSAIKITTADFRGDPGPGHFAPVPDGQCLNDLGIYDNRFVYYAATLNITDQELAKNKSLALKITCPGGDHVIAMLNDEQLQSAAGTGEGMLATGHALHAGENHLLMLYENSGVANNRIGMEKRAGISRVQLLPATAGSHGITGWKMRLIERSGHRRNFADINPDTPDTDWPQLASDQMTADQLKPRQTAVFRTEVNLTSQDISAGWTALSLERIDDDGLVTVNGKTIGRTDRWDQWYTFDAASELHPGKNTIAIVVHNEDGAGGLGAVSWSHPETKSIGTLSDFSFSDRSQGIAGKWFQPNTDPAGWKSETLPEQSTTDSLLTWSRLKFDLPKSSRNVWVPWLLRLHAKGNGTIYVNGHLLGRYWQDGNQSDFFLPDCWLRPGQQNVITLCLRPIDGRAAVDSAEIMPYTVYAESR